MELSKFIDIFMQISIINNNIKKNTSDNVYKLMFIS